MDKNFSRLLLWILVALQVIVCSLALPDKKYNVLYLIADDLRPEFSGVYGQAQVKTPNVDKLAAESLVFAKAYCQQAVCGPSRNSFMTGRRPHHTNVLGGTTGDDFRKVGIDASGSPGIDWTTLPGHFKKSGFTTLGGGKTFHPNNPKNFDYPRSWSTDMANNSNTTTGQGYFGYSYFLSNKSHPFPGGLPISWACPGAGKPSSENHANGNSLGGPIAVWCALDIPDKYFYDSGLANNTIDRLRYAAKLFNDTGKPFFVMSGCAMLRLLSIATSFFSSLTPITASLHAHTPRTRPLITV